MAALRFKSGALGVIEAATSAFPGLLKRTEIHGVDGSARVEQDDITLWSFRNETDEDKRISAEISGRSASNSGASDPRGISHAGHRDQLSDFLSAIESGGSAKVDGREGRKAVEIIRGIYRSAELRRTIELPQ